MCENKWLRDARLASGLTPQALAHAAAHTAAHARAARAMHAERDGARCVYVSRAQVELKEVGCNVDELLWLRTLDRYGKNCRHWAIARPAHDLIPECPVLRPTAKEFAEPGRYFQTILPQIAEYGMCKVVPPPGWKPPPWSGRPPKGFNERSPITSDSVEAAVRASCRPVRGGDNGHL